jgi:hypothetical protein
MASPGRSEDEGENRGIGEKAREKARKDYYENGRA